jgi:hypothetical protein
VTGVETVLGEARLVPGGEWLSWDAAARDAVQGELVGRLMVRLAAAGLVAVAPVLEVLRIDELRGEVTLLAEVRARLGGAGL